MVKQNMYMKDSKPITNQSFKPGDMQHLFENDNKVRHGNITTRLCKLTLFTGPSVAKGVFLSVNINDLSSFAEVHEEGSDITLANQHIEDLERQ